jgi:RNA polymerase sigma-70 factor (ECF subfamily)
MSIEAAMELETLMARYIDGDDGAFRELYVHAGPRVLGYLKALTREPALADDLLQLTFLKVHRARASYIRGAAPLPWIFAIAQRSFLDEVRRRKRARIRLADEAALPEIAAGLDGSPEAQRAEVADPTQLAAVHAALAQLRPSWRDAIMLLKLEGKSVAQAAALQGTTIAAMRVRAQRGYAALREVLVVSERSPAPGLG